MQQFIDSFKTISKNVVIARSDKYDIRKLLITSSLMITDYSSVALDFAYMKKPVTYYQFDIERFRKAQYEKGYYDYEKSGLGVVTEYEDGVVDNIISSYKNNFSVSSSFLFAHKKFFTIYDKNNCKRTYEAIKRIQ